MKQHNVVFTGGGTGGHVFPGIAIAEKLLTEKEKYKIAWIGSNSGMEREIVKRFNISFYSIPAGKLRRYFSIYNFLDLFKIITGIIFSLILLKKLKTDLIFSKGGFVTVPPVFAAKLLGIKVISHESDLDPGLATKINGRFSRKMLFAYKETKENWNKTFPRQELIVSGNPVRKEIFKGSSIRGKTLYNIPESKKIILILGGSQGARQINSFIEDILDELTKTYFVIHQMGKPDYKESRRENYITASLFTDNFPDILAASNLVISRAGAGTLWESGVLGKPSILIPLGSGSSRGDQVRNADFFEKNGAAIVLKGKNLNPDELLSEINRLLSAKKVRNELEKNVKLLCNANSAEIISNIIKQDI